MASELLQKSSLHPLENPAVFFKYVAGSEPFPYQEAYLLDESKRKIFSCGRKVGKTFVAAANALWRACSIPRREEFCVAPAQRQSSILFRQVWAFAQAPEVREHIVRETASILGFDNGSSIYVTPAGAAGKTSRGIIPTGLHFDEASQIPDGVYIALLPAVQQTDILEDRRSIFMYSSPFGKRGEFWNAWNSPYYAKFHASALDCPLTDLKAVEEFREGHTEAEYAQEVLGEFVSEADAYFTHELVSNCVEDCQKPRPEQSGFDYYLGVDFARFGTDETVYCIIEADDKQNGRVVHMESTSRVPLTDAMGRITALHEKWNFRHIWVDDNGLGGGVTDVQRERHLPLTGFKFVNPYKSDGYKSLKNLMEKGKVKFFHHEKLMMQLVAMEYGYQSGGDLTIHHPDRGHDDWADALMLACQGIARAKVSFKIGLGAPRR